jgi:hypothetical protein
MKFYTVKNLGAWTGLELSDRKTAVGHKNDVAHRYRSPLQFPLKSSLAPISLPAATIGSHAHGINPGKRKEVGEFIVGDRVENPFPPVRAWLLRDGIFLDLHSHLNAVESGAHGVNDHGVVAGWAVMAQGGGAFRFDPGSDEVEFLAGQGSKALAINDHGHVAGEVGGSPRRVFLHDGSLTLLPTLARSSSYSCRAMNDHDVVVGYRDLEDGGSRAFRYDYTTQEMVDLHESSGKTAASDVNNANEVVGGWSIETADSIEDFAVIWSPGASMQKLDDLIDAPYSLHLEHACSINNNGQILAQGTIGSETSGRTFLLTPTIAMQFKPDTLAQLVDLILLGGGGIIRLPSGELLHPKGPPIDPGGPFFGSQFQALDPAQRDVLVGLAVQVLAKNLPDAEARRVAEMGGLEAVRKAVETLMQSLREQD